ncbi:hypothetical protein AM1_A0222 (plasmid) [Acaryochloris marina MBIC11017]|uniref:Uncharacterized protein n=1 Tax=Acaryochloris marina (strain MBIC 11017) TaxID=329726 RepID=A8ZKM5_ACAM1|nr:hypothetical protein AM1_A0222 [Acaryochloris marina MBIC11017]
MSPIDLMRIFNQHVDMIFTDHAFLYADILCIAYLDEQLTASVLHFTFGHLITILGNPSEMLHQGS